MADRRDPPAAIPDTIFLAEAFSRPAVMHRLAQIGFTQSYTYFAWRESACELREYFTELASPPSVDELRPNALAHHARHPARAPPARAAEAFAVRLVLAATLSPSYGSTARPSSWARTSPRPTAARSIADSEKYQVRSWDLSTARTLRPLMGQLNRIRRDHLALHTLRTLRFHGSDNDASLCFSKTPHAGPSVDPREPSAATVVVVVNLDPAPTPGGRPDPRSGRPGPGPVAAVPGRATCSAGAPTRGRATRTGCDSTRRSPRPTCSAWRRES